MEAPVQPLAVAMTLADVEAQEQELTQRKAAFVEQANQTVAAFDGALMHVRMQKEVLLNRQQAAEAAATPTGKKPRSRVAKKASAAA